MRKRNRFKGKDVNGNWHSGNLTVLQVDVKDVKKGCYISNKAGLPFAFQVRPETVRQCTGLPDGKGLEMFGGDITELEVDGEIRRFVVKVGTVVRDIVSHPSFTDETARASITGVYFEWQGFKLFPLVDEHGVPDNERMVIVGNVWDNPELLEGVSGND
ncbi:phage uncharacterized protein TIGR01671 [Paenibacillus algorifonticola]|uniref:Phage uncharacterized protein TIGR01671 n=1 Tax=Paenibacillus algorifonticola TaxID=684063 RepID=A0A1I2ADV9_9BACL|nr:YopX family protein [Paenibacillus algorifonticola]SFE42204.1 phage uncharacterized protein TIGR01671 [Paenibacillus algorifonticola]